MGQSMTFYRIPGSHFEELKNSNGNKRLDWKSAKSYITLQGTFMGLEFVLSKDQDTSVIKLINEIFSPKQSLGSQNFESLSIEKQMELYENESIIPYLDPATISDCNDLLERVSDEDLRSKYSAKEFNDNEIYPWAWSDDGSPDTPYNERSLLDDLSALKTFFKLAKEEKDYILIFVG